MRLVNSIRNLHFTGKEHADGGWAIDVADETNPVLVFDQVTVIGKQFTAQQFSNECIEWMNDHSDGEIDVLRRTARSRRVSSPVRIG